MIQSLYHASFLIIKSILLEKKNWLILRNSKLRNSKHEIDNNY